jgi:hypothetical protein
VETLPLDANASAAMECGFIIAANEERVALVKS